MSIRTWRTRCRLSTTTATAKATTTPGQTKSAKQLRAKRQKRQSQKIVRYTEKKKETVRATANEKINDIGREEMETWTVLWHVYSTVH